MKLSDAMMLGQMMCKMVPADINSCAYGVAGNSIGIPQATVTKYNQKTPTIMGDGRCRLELIYDAWPWLYSDGGYVANSIWLKFDFGVCQGHITYEQLVDYVRSVEPSCGDCNEFSCTCVQKMDETPTLQLQEVTQ